MRQGQKVKGIQIRRNALVANHLLVMADYLFFLFWVCLVEEKNEGQKMREEKRGEKSVFGRRMEIEEGTKNSGD